MKHPLISIWVIKGTDLVYSLKVSRKFVWCGVPEYYHDRAKNCIPFCDRYEEHVEDFLAKYPNLRNAIYKALNRDMYSTEISWSDAGKVDFYPMTLNYIQKGEKHGNFIH